VALTGALLSPGPLIAADEASEWNGLPPEWREGADYTAFCRPGGWSFDALGERMDHCDEPSCRRGPTSFDRVFFKIIGRHGAKWRKAGPQVDEVTILKISRAESGEITMEASAGDVLAVRQMFAVSRTAGLFRRERPTDCKAGQAWQFESNWWPYDEGREHVSLALAADGSLLAHVRGKYKNRAALLPILVLEDDEWRYYARFPALDAGPPPGIK
jgi:hypothetical protein